MNESIYINSKITGLFNFDNLCNMEFDQYEKLIDIANQIGKK